MGKNNKTDNFLKAINKYSKLERQQIQNDIETVRDEELKKAEANGKKMAKDFITKEYSAVKTAVTGQYAVKNLEAQGKVYKKREEITTSVFEKAFAKLKDFTSTPQYKDLLIKSAKEIADIFKENSCVIFISENDNKFAQDIKAQFSGEVTVENDVAIPPSLKNIYKELHDDMGCYIPNNGNLTKWAKQGVLLLNSVLTVEKNKPNSHKNKGWEQITGKVVELLNQRVDPVIFLLWGSNAKAIGKNIDRNKHYVLEAVHPSPMSANQGGWFGCHHFSKTNEILRKLNKTPIDWQIENI